MTASIDISEQEQRALDDLTKRLRSQLPVSRVILFGSRVTGTADEESDIDLLILVDCPVSIELRKLVINETFEVNLEHGVNISSLVVEDRDWREGLASVLPLHNEVEEVGVDL